VSAASENGAVVLSSDAFLAVNESFSSGLIFGGEDVIGAQPFSTDVYVFSWENEFSAGSSYRFSGGSSIVGLTAPSGYLGTFVPGVYNIEDTTSGFGRDAGGTFTILVPEPATYGTLVGVAALGFALCRRRRQ
jgi:hypothetical protein